MTKKGEHRFEQQTLNIVRILGFVAPAFLFIYGLFITKELFDTVSSQYISEFWIIMIPWLTVATIQLIKPPQTKLYMLLVLTAHHLFAGLYILFISDFTMPLLNAWALLYLVSYIYFSHTGLVLSIFFFFFVLIMQAMLRPNNIESVTYTIFTSMSILLVGLAAISLNRIKEYDRETIAKSKRSEELERERLLTLVNNIADPIISTDPAGKITLYNAATLSLLDTNAHLKKQRIDDVLALTDSNGKPQPILQLLKNARGVTINDSLTTIIGDESIRVELTYSPIKTGSDDTGSDGYVIIVRDVTKAKSLEEERDEFISVVSHELRTPIAIAEGAIGNSRLIYGKKHDDKKISDSLTLAHEQVIFLSKMVNDLSTLSRAERGVADASEVIDISSLVHALHQEHTGEAKAKGLVFNISAHKPLGTVFASRLYLQELLQNFITNAIKYTKKGSVTLAVRREDDNVIFEVTDTGIGISKSDQAKIFQKFYRSEDYRTRETGGTGLGLYVAVKLAKKLGCTIEVKSRLNHGSTFSFSLPLHTKEPRSR
jgi:PAS domain S-box-containing protein